MPKFWKVISYALYDWLVSKFIEDTIAWINIANAHYAAYKEYSKRHIVYEGMEVNI